MDHQPQAPLTTTIRAVRRRAERVRRQELARRTRQLRGLNPHQQATVEELTRRLVERLLHHPIIRCTQLAAGPDGHRYVDLLHALYGPEPEPGASEHEPSRSALPPTTECRHAERLEARDAHGVVAATVPAGTPAAGPDPRRLRPPGA
jgi:hypothetical protein